MSSLTNRKEKPSQLINSPRSHSDAPNYVRVGGRATNTNTNTATGAAASPKFILLLFTLIVLVSFAFIARGADTLHQTVQRPSSHLDEPTPELARQRPPDRKRTSRIYRIRATPTNGKLGPPVRVELAEEPAAPEGGQFGARQQVAAAHRTQTPVACNQSESGESSLAAEANSIAASSQTLRLLPVSARTSVDGQQQVGRLREVEGDGVEHHQGGPRAPKGEELNQNDDEARQSQELDTHNDLSSLVDDFDSKIITNKTKGKFCGL